MRRKAVIIVLLLSLALLFGCPAKNGGTVTGSGTVLTGAETTKSVAEDILYYARVYYNLGKINEAQFKSVKDAYDVLYVVQNQMIDARIAYLKMPSDATADQKYRLAIAQVASAQAALVQLATQFGILTGDAPAIPIRK